MESEERLRVHFGEAEKWVVMADSSELELVSTVNHHHHHQRWQLTLLQAEVRWRRRKSRRSSLLHWLILKSYLPPSSLQHVNSFPERSPMLLTINGAASVVTSPQNTWQVNLLSFSPAVWSCCYPVSFLQLSASLGKKQVGVFVP